MPIYAYQCTECGSEEEHIQKFSDPPMTACEVCGGGLRRKVTSAAFHLKGGGWYKDLYASAKPGDGGKAGESSPAGDASSGPKESGSKESGPKESGPKETKPAASGTKDSGGSGGSGSSGGSGGASSKTKAAS